MDTQIDEQPKKMIVAHWPIMVIDLTECAYCGGEEVANEYPEARCPECGGAGVHVKYTSPATDRQPLHD